MTHSIYFRDKDGLATAQFNANPGDNQPFLTLGIMGICTSRFS